MILDAAKETFRAESQELLEQMESILLRVEAAPAGADEESINALFRAVHTIKGSAGLFGLDSIVAFAHVAENVLDRIRNAEIQLDANLVNLFLQTNDQLNRLLESEFGGQGVSEDLRLASESLVSQLRVYSDVAPPTSPAPEAVPTANAQVHVEDGLRADSDNWHISVRFGKEIMRSGLDPLSILRYLATLGEIRAIATHVENVPALSSIDAEACYLGFELGLYSDASKENIEGAFEFVREDSLIRILPPHSKVIDYLELIDELPEANMKLGEILVACGSLTEKELARALQEQSAAEQAVRPPLGEVLIKQQVVQAEVVSGALDKQKQVENAKKHEANSIRVDSAKLDRLIDQVGELIIAGASANLQAQKSGNTDLIEANVRLSRLVEDVRESALKLRMIQIGTVFSRFRRLVRDVSRELGKDIQLEISGEETELDKSLVETLADPLTHIVRNALDHGIGTTEERLAQGKPAQGHLKMHAYHDSGCVVIEVSDDGAGLNQPKIVQKAIERGLVDADATLTEQEIFNLIFEPGFSTADAISNLSGRGVGMDVVRRNITALRGTIEVASTPGVGTRFSIRLPLTLAIIDGFLIGVGAASYVVPLELVVECIELPLGLQTSGSADTPQYLNLRGEVLPFIRLRELFEVADEFSQRENVVVVQYNGQRIGLVVDQLLGEFQTVIKPLGCLLENVCGIGGSTILGSGDVALVLDVPSLVVLVTKTNSSGTQSGARPNPQALASVATYQEDV